MFFRHIALQSPVFLIFLGREGYYYIVILRGVQGDLKLVQTWRRLRHVSDCPKSVAIPSSCLDTECKARPEQVSPIV